MSDNEMSTKRFWDDRNAQMDSDVAANVEYAASRSGRLARLVRQFTTADANSATAEEIQALLSQITAIKAEIQGEEDADWTRETTISRRAAWNAAVKNPVNRKGGAVLVGQIERALGFGLGTLKRQVGRHGL
jgi:hypothetical protein